MPELITQFMQHGSVVVLLLIVLWAGHKGLWYWGGGVRAIVRTVERERNEWRQLSLASFKKMGLDLPRELLEDPKSAIEYLSKTEKLDL